MENNLVNIPWNPKANTTLIWNDICASIIEQFGLPGDRYKTEVSTDGMKFFFKDQRDCFMCKILISERVE